jgi:hypothetical protein
MGDAIYVLGHSQTEIPRLIKASGDHPADHRAPAAERGHRARHAGSRSGLWRRRRLDAGRRVGWRVRLGRRHRSQVASMPPTTPGSRTRLGPSCRRWCSSESRPPSRSRSKHSKVGSVGAPESRPVWQTGEMIAEIKLVGSIAGLLLGALTAWDRVVLGRPVAFITTKGSPHNFLNFLRVKNVSPIDILIFNSAPFSSSCRCRGC